MKIYQDEDLFTKKGGSKLMRSQTKTMDKKPNTQF